MTISSSGVNRKILLGGTARSPEDVTSLQELGLGFAEITIANPADFHPLLEKYRALPGATEFFYLCHGPREGDPNNINALETIYLPKLLQILHIMPELEMKLLTLHLWMDPRFVSKQAIDYKTGFLGRVTEKASNSGIIVCLENLSESAGHLEEVFAAVPELNLTLDLGHAELLTDENTSFGFLENCPERIKHIHMHDNRGGNSPDDDLHLPPGDGKIDFHEIFEKLHAVHYWETITLELRPEQIESCLKYVKRLVYPTEHRGDEAL
ncbi:MAG: sugar phosphate isomerase/epimerase family protein [Syntrophobacteraceae bacterium]